MKKHAVSILVALVLVIALVPVATVAAAAGVLDHVAISPASTDITVGTTQQFTAQGQDSGNVTVTNNVTYAWAVVAGGGTIDSNGLFTAGSVPGTFNNTVKVTATQGSTNVTAYASVIVSPALDHVVISPTSTNITVGASQKFTAQGQDSSNVTVSGVTYAWAVVAGGGTIDNSGNFTAGGVTDTFTNTVQVIAVQGSIIRTAYASVMVSPLPGAPTLDHVVISPTSANITVNAAQQFTAQGEDSGNVTIPGLTYTWAVVAGGGTINSSGLFTAANVTGTFNNTVKVTATQGSANATAFASVIVSPAPVQPTLDHVVISPTSANITVGGTQQFTAQGQDSSNVSISGLTYTWIVVAGGGTIDNNGLFTAGNVTGTFNNTVQVIAVQGGIVKTAYASVIVSPSPTPEVLDHVVISPVVANIIVNATQQFAAQGQDSGNIAIPGLAYSWAVVNGGGTIDNSGNFTAGNVTGTFSNTVQVIAVQGGIIKTAYATVVVLAAPSTGLLDHIVISPASANVLIDAQQQFTAQGQDSGNVSIPGLTYSWAVVNGGGSIDSNGLFTASNVTGTFTNTVQVIVVQGSIVKTAYATVTVSATPVPPEGKLPPGFSKGNKNGWGGGSTPPGWSNGNKNGWGGGTTPPGLSGNKGVGNGGTPPGLAKGKNK